jgi:tripartite-type tricarboxylate transporter receptor subunit TctC
MNPLLRAFALAALTASQAAWAAFPDKPVHIVVPFPSGAAADASTRVVARKLADFWGQPVIVENRPGAPGIQGVAAAPADGHTLLIGAASLLATAPLLNPALAYRTERDFVAVGQTFSSTPSLVVHPSLGVKTVKELMAYAKARPGKVAYASTGIGSANHLTMELFQSATGTKLLHVPYKGGGQQITDILANHVQMGILSVPSVLQHVQSGALVAVAVTAARRDRALPNVQTMTEAGVKGIEFEVWYGLFAPIKTPPAVVQKINADLQRALKDPEISRQLLALGGEPAPTTPEQFGKYVAAETAMWADLIKKHNITGQ